MIDWFRQLGRASGNLGRFARRNPVWVVQSLIFSPFPFAGHLLRVVVLMLIVATVLILSSDALVWYLCLARYPLLHSLIMVAVSTHPPLSFQHARTLTGTHRRIGLASSEALRLKAAW